MLALDGSQIGIALLIILFLIISVLMVLVVLIQRPQGGGLSGAFGSSSEGAGQTAFGAKVGDALTTATIMIFVLFLVSAVGLNLLIEPPADRMPTVSAEGAGTMPPATPPATDGAGMTPGTTDGGTAEGAGDTGATEPDATTPADPAPPAPPGTGGSSDAPQGEPTPPPTEPQR